MRHKIKTVRETAVKDKCGHYWIIEGPEGPTSRGVCKFCGEEKEFYNSWRYFVGGGQFSKPAEGR